MYRENDKYMNTYFPNSNNYLGNLKEHGQAFSHEAFSKHTEWVVEINTSEDVRNCMNATRLPGGCEFHVEVTITVARGDQRQREGAARGIGFRRARGQTARGVCSKQFQLTCWNWNRTCTRICPADSRLVDATTSRTMMRTWAFLPSSVRRVSSFFFVKFCRYSICVRKLVVRKNRKTVMQRHKSRLRNCAISLRIVRFIKIFSNAVYATIIFN